MKHYLKIIFIITIINFIELNISNALSRAYITFPLTFLFYSYYVYKSDESINPIEAFLFGLFVDLISNSYFGLNVKEYPKIWFKNVKISKTFDVNLNRFKVVSGLSREHWIEKGWIFKEDPLGWFQWYCRYTNGRRIPLIDEIQIKRWKNFRRHVLAIEKNCEKGDLGCRKRQRQAILQWAYDPYR